MGTITSDGAALITFAKATGEVPVHPPDTAGQRLIEYLLRQEVANAASTRIGGIPAMPGALAPARVQAIGGISWEEDVPVLASLGHLKPRPYGPGPYGPGLARVLIARVLVALVIALVILAPSHQAKGYGEDDQNDSSAYKFHTLNLQVAEPRHERPRHLKFGTASGEVPPLAGVGFASSRAADGAEQPFTYRVRADAVAIIYIEGQDLRLQERSAERQGRSSVKARCRTAVIAAGGQAVMGKATSCCGYRPGRSGGSESFRMRLTHSRAGTEDQMAGAPPVDSRKAAPRQSPGR